MAWTQKISNLLAWQRGPQGQSQIVDVRQRLWGRPHIHPIKMVLGRHRLCILIKPAATDIRLYCGLYGGDLNGVFSVDIRTTEAVAHLGLGLFVVSIPADEHMKDSFKGLDFECEQSL